MFKLVVALSLLAAANAGNLGLAYSSPLLAAPYAAAPIAHVAAPIAVKAALPVATSYQNTYKISTNSVPVIAAAPVIKAAPVLSYAAPAPIVKTIAPALSYAAAPALGYAAAPALSYGGLAPAVGYGGLSPAVGYGGLSSAVGYGGLSSAVGYGGLAPALGYGGLAHY